MPDLLQPVRVGVCVAMVNKGATLRPPLDDRFEQEVKANGKTQQRDGARTDVPPKQKDAIRARSAAWLAISFRPRQNPQPNYSSMICPNNGFI